MSIDTLAETLLDRIEDKATKGWSNQTWYWKCPRCYLLWLRASITDILAFPCLIKAIGGR